MRVLIYGDPDNLPQLVGMFKGQEIDAITYEKIDVPVSKLIVVNPPPDGVEWWAEAVNKVLDGYDLFVTPFTRDGSDLASRVAAKRMWPLLGNVISVSLGEGLVAEKVIFGGKGKQAFRLDIPAVLSVYFQGAEPVQGSPNVVEEITRPDYQPKAKVLERKKKEAEVDLSKAEVVVAVGRGLKRKEDLDMIRELANLLGGEVACTRPLSADLKWLPEERHVGMTGVRVRPKLYIALGISGQIQHVVGFRDAGTVIAINTDPDAPIFDVSDYGAVADLYEVVPLLIKELKG